MFNSIIKNFTYFFHSEINYLFLSLQNVFFSHCEKFTVKKRLVIFPTKNRCKFIQYMPNKPAPARKRPPSCDESAPAKRANKDSPKINSKVNQNCIRNKSFCL